MTGSRTLSATLIRSMALCRPFSLSAGLQLGLEVFLPADQALQLGLLQTTLGNRRDQIDRCARPSDVVIRAPCARTRERICY
ncbi:hypothetical protein CKO25_07575 [Thiocapsa imhoffii]|uniref:Uncharacterized protein n=1 Tax=Thiocapsa imhoffii TaxID=382777 RepID=A0A9X0WHA4_9GAMM|nr:hypothetical protein [Thiocapsa imhoffii]